MAKPPNPVPKNVAAALGLVPTVVEGVRRLPTKAVQLPVIAVGTALTRIDKAKRGYDDLAERGERLIARLRGTSFDELEDRFEDSLQGVPSVANLYDRAEDAAEKVLDKVAGNGKGATKNAAQSVQEGTQRAQDRAEAATAVDAVQETLPEAEQPKGEPTAKATAPDTTRVDSAASPDVVEKVDQIAANVGGEPLPHDELPLPDYDHMTLGSLRGRLRSLDMRQLVQLRAYEKSKADRLPVVTMLDNRIAKLSSGEATPTGSAPAGGTTAAGKPHQPAR